MKKITFLFSLLMICGLGTAQNGGDDCSSAVSVTPGSFTDTTINDVNAGTNNGDSAWFSYTATADGTIDISVCADPDEPDTRVFVWDGTCAALNAVADDDDGCPNFSFASDLADVPVVNGTTYYIQWDDRWSTDPFDWTLTYNAPPTCGDPENVVANPTDVNATFSWDAPVFGTPTGYNWEIQPDGVAQGTPGALDSGTVGTTMVTSGDVLAADTDYEFYVQTDCDVDGTSSYVTIGFTTTAGPAPANDDFANAQPIDCTTTNLIGSTDTATLDEDDAPDGFGADMDAPNVWFSYDSAVEGANEVTVDLCPSAYDTSVLVYTGTSGNLTLVAGNDDNGAQCGGSGGTTRSYLSFDADGVQTYYIAVEGWDPGSVGTFDLTITCAPLCSPAQANQDCASAVGIPVDGSTVTVDNTCATVNPNQTACDLFNGIADIWYTFTAPASGEVDIVSAVGTATASHLAVYSGTCGALVDEGCSSADPSATLNLTGLTGGATYYLQVWNNGSEEGTMDLTLTDASLSLASVENENAFSYFPNPVKNELSLRAQNNIQNVSVFNMLGQEVLRSAPNTLEANLDMNGLGQGAYFVQVTINNVTETVRIIKQ